MGWENKFVHVQGGRNEGSEGMGNMALEKIGLPEKHWLNTSKREWQVGKEKNHGAKA